MCIFCTNEPKRRGSVKWYHDQNALLNHLKQCPCKSHFSYIKDEVYQLMKKGIQNGFDEKIVSRLNELEVESRK